MTKKYTINDLPLFSPWPARLLGLESFPKKNKNKTEIEREYEKEKWGPLLEAIQKIDNVTIGQTDEIYSGHKKILYYDQGNFKLDEAYEVHKKTVHFITKTISPYLFESNNIVELGCGYGTIILALANKNKKHHYFATEFTKSGQKIAELIAKNQKINIKIGHCDITQTPITTMSIPTSSVIFTSCVTSLIPKLSEDFIYNMITLKPKVVIHVEPFYEHTGEEDLYSLLRRRYIEINDYNRNLLRLLEKSEAKHLIQIIRNEPNCFGSNPLFCYSIVAWRPIEKRKR